MDVRGLLLLIAGLLWLSAAYGDCPCGPTYCTGTPEYKAALATKKKALLKEYPARLVAILDRVGHCEHCVTSGPDGFSLLIKDTHGKLLIDHWDADNERIGAKDLASGKLTACRVIYARRACGCCQEKQPEERPDWDNALELNTEMSVPCAAN